MGPMSFIPLKICKSHILRNGRYGLKLIFSVKIWKDYFCQNGPKFLSSLKIVRPIFWEAGPLKIHNAHFWQNRPKFLSSLTNRKAHILENGPKLWAPQTFTRPISVKTSAFFFPRKNHAYFFAKWAQISFPAKKLHISINGPKVVFR